MAKKVKRWRCIPFKEPQPFRVWIALERAENPFKKAKELGVADNKKLRKIYDLMFINALVMTFYLSAFLSLFV